MAAVNAFTPSAGEFETVAVGQFAHLPPDLSFPELYGFLVQSDSVRAGPCGDDRLL